MLSSSFAMETSSQSFYGSKLRKRHLQKKTTFGRHLSIARKLLAQNTDQFCRNTSLHGLKYLADKDLHLLEKIYFGAAFVIVVVLGFYFAGRVIDKWTNTPVILGINPQPTLITQVPFPAVTICNLNMAHKTEAARYPNTSVEYAMLQMLCRRKVNVSIANTITDWSGLNQFITSIGQPCNSMLLSCRYGAITYNCSDLFRPIVTDEGLCCAFNMLHPYFMYSSFMPLKDNVTDLAGFVPVRWSAEMGYPKDLPSNYYPRPAVGTGETLGLSITINVESDEYYCSSANSIGFKILLHSPNELPSLREVGLLLAGAGRETKVRIHTEKTESVQSIRTVNKLKRNCLFENEEELKLFTHYTQHNCELECIAETMLKFCGCVTNYMPRFYGNETICSIYDSTCVERIRIYSMLTANGNYSCSKFCLPSCYDLSFQPDFFSTPLTHEKFQFSKEQLKNRTSEYIEENIGVVHIYFKENLYRSNKQTEFFGITDVLSNIGGLIGVFFGFSFISFAEFIYYAVLRPIRATREARLLNESVVLVNRVSRKELNILKSARKRYRRELGFQIKRPADVQELNISDLYMSSEFYKKKTKPSLFLQRNNH